MEAAEGLAGRRGREHARGGGKNHCTHFTLRAANPLFLDMQQACCKTCSQEGSQPAR